MHNTSMEEEGWGREALKKRKEKKLGMYVWPLDDVYVG